MEAPVHHADDDAPIREAVRAVLLDRENRLLLFKAYRDDTRGAFFWITPGGGIDDGESALDALQRELGEECGLAHCEIGPLVWVREHEFLLPGLTGPVRQRERFYLVRVEQHEVDVTGWDDLERIFMGEHRWWTVDELRSSSEEFAPRRLASLVADLVGGHIPDDPLNAGI